MALSRQCGLSWHLAFLRDGARVDFTICPYDRLVDMDVIYADNCHFSFRLRTWAEVKFFGQTEFHFRSFSWSSYRLVNILQRSINNVRWLLYFECFRLVKSIFHSDLFRVRNSMKCVNIRSGPESAPNRWPWVDTFCFVAFIVLRVLIYFFCVSIACCLSLVGAQREGLTRRNPDM